MNAVIYTRVAVSDDAGHSAAQQVSQCQKWIEANGHTLVKTYQDVGPAYSGKTKLPQRDQMFLDAKDHTFGIIVIVTLDRLSRHNETFMRLLNDSVLNETYLVAVAQNIDLSREDTKGLPALLNVLVNSFFDTRLQSRVDPK